MAVARCLIYRALNDGYVFRCGICDEPIKLEDEIQFDHVHELADSGQDNYQNLRPVHTDPCHRQKSASSVTFRAHIKRLSEGGRKKRYPQMKGRPFPKVKRPFG